MAKRRSIRQIQKQIARISRSGYTNRERLNQAYNIAARYQQNIRNSAAYRNDVAYLQDYAERAYDNGYMNAGRVVQTYGGDRYQPAEYDFRVNESAFPKLSERRYKREYAPSVYRDGQRTNAPRSKFAGARTATVNTAMANVGG